MTAAGRDLLRSWTEPNAEQLAERSAWTRDWLALRIPDIEAEAAARAVDEALSVDRVAEALHKALGHGYHGGGWDHGDGDLAAALVAHLRGPRP